MSADQDQTPASWNEFARQHVALLVAVLLRVVGSPRIAFDLAAETLATLRRRWSDRAAEDEQRLIWAFESSHERESHGA